MVVLLIIIIKRSSNSLVSIRKKNVSIHKYKYLSHWIAKTQILNGVWQYNGSYFSSYICSLIYAYAYKRTTQTSYGSCSSTFTSFVSTRGMWLSASRSANSSSIFLNFARNSLVITFNSTMRFFFTSSCFPNSTFIQYSFSFSSRHF